MSSTKTFSKLLGQPGRLHRDDEEPPANSRSGFAANQGREVLNPPLYTALEREFGPVRIANQGESANGPSGGWGEYYRVSCPYCDDERQRLWFNHLFAVRSETGGSNLHVVICYNSGCVDSRRRQQELRDRLFPFSFRVSQFAPNPARSAAPGNSPAAATSTGPVTLPHAYSLSEPVAHTARSYLISRQFDVDEISERWQVQYCVNSPDSTPYVANSLIVPVFALRQRLFATAPERHLVGWQARNLDTNPAGPKYLTMWGMKVSQLLYGATEVQQPDQPLVIVEGVTDVWRLGGNAVATFGKSMSAEQHSLIIQHFAGRPVVIMFDRDATAEADQAAESLRRVRREWKDPAPVYTSLPPEGFQDVGDATRQAAWESVHATLARPTSTWRQPQ